MPIRAGRSAQLQYDNLISRNVVMRVLSFITGCAVTVSGFCVSELGAAEQVSLQVPERSYVIGNPEFNVEDDTLLTFTSLPEPDNDMEGYTFLLSGKPESMFQYDGTYCYTKRKGVEVRTQADMDSEVLTTLVKDARVLQISTNDAWSKIRLEDGEEGYCLSNTLINEADATPTPTPTNAPTATPTNTPTPKPTKAPGAKTTNTPTPTQQAKRPTNTSTPTPTKKPEKKVTNTPTPTKKPEKKATNTPTPTPKPKKATNTPTPTPKSEKKATNTPTPTPKSSQSWTEKEYKATVYTTTTVNIRKGPGTDYGTYKTVSSGTKLSVVAETDNGWYKLDNGYYIMAKYTSTKTPATATPTPTSTSTKHDTSKPFDQYVKSFLGIPYVFGTSSPTSADCSGLVKYVFSKYYGIVLPHSASAQYKYGTEADTKNLKCADLVFFDYNKDGKIDHVGIYIGNNTVVHASQSRGKVISSTYSAMSCIYGARRLV